MPAPLTRLCAAPPVSVPLPEAFASVTEAVLSRSTFPFASRAWTVAEKFTATVAVDGTLEKTSRVAATSIAFCASSLSAAAVVTPLPVTATSLPASLNSRFWPSVSVAVFCSDTRSVSVLEAPSAITTLRPVNATLPAAGVPALPRAVPPSKRRATRSVCVQSAGSLAAPCVRVRAVTVASPAFPAALARVNCHACAPSPVVSITAAFPTEERVADSPPALASVRSFATLPTV